jgi:hypothetical protein
MTAIGDAVAPSGWRLGQNDGVCLSSGDNSVGKISHCLGRFKSISLIHNQNEVVNQVADTLSMGLFRFLKSPDERSHTTDVIEVIQALGSKFLFFSAFIIGESLKIS